MAKESLKERMRKKGKELKDKSGGSNIVFLKDGDSIRSRILNMGEDEEFIMEVTQFYLGNEIKGVISPVTFDEPCAIFDKYQELSQSEDKEEQEMAKKFNMRKRYLAYCAIYKDGKGKELDDRSPRFMLLTGGMYQSVIQYFLDEDDWGDMTDPSAHGYDIKFGRTGSGKTDTEYTVTPCPKSPAPAKFAKQVFSLEEVVRKIMPSYEETEDLLKRFLGDDVEENFKEAAKSPRSRRRRQEATDDLGEDKGTSRRRRRRG